MRIARTLVLALAAAIAAMALGATSASAQAVELTNVNDPERPVHCDLAAQNCKIVAHSESETSLRGHQFGFESTVSRCLDEFTGFVGEDGTGHIVQQHLEDGPSLNCEREPCGDEVHLGGESEWPAVLRESAPDELTMEIEFCLEQHGHDSPVHCELDVDVTLDGHHSAEFRAEDSAQSDHHKECHHVEGSSAMVEVEGHWESEPEESDEIEVTHLP